MVNLIEIKDVKEQIRQGDILLVAIPYKPDEFTVKSSTETVAIGEGSNHQHNIKQALIYKYEDQSDIAKSKLNWDNTMLGIVVVDDVAKIVHELPNGQKAEHDPLDIPKGAYLLKRQREFDGVDSRIVLD